MRSISWQFLSVRAIFVKVFFGCLGCLFLWGGLAVGFLGQTVEAATPAYVRVIHASPFVGTADVFVDGQKLLTSFEFASVTDYVSVPPGTHKVQIALVGKGLNAAVLTQDLTVEEGKVYTVAALGTSAAHLSLQAFVDDNHFDPTYARVRFYQLSPNAGNVDVSVGGDKKVAGVTYPTVSDYIQTDPGPCTFTVTNPSSSLPPLTTTLDTQMVTSVFLVGMFNKTPQAQLVYKQSSATPGLPQTGNNPSPLADNGSPLAPGVLWLIGGVLVLSLLVLRKWWRRGLGRAGTI